MKRQPRHHLLRRPKRRGSTLVIVISMLALLSLIGTVFYTFAMQERSAAEYFAASEKRSAELPGDPFDHANEMIISGATRDDQIFSILYSHTGRHSMARNMIGDDLSPHTGQGVRTTYDTGTGLPVRDENSDGLADAVGTTEDNLINLVDSPMAYLDTITEAALQTARQYGGTAGVPVPDVDYTTPDINNPFLGWRGWTIRDNGAGSPRFERVQVIIPSFMRPQLLKSSLTNDDTGTADVPTDADWYDHAAGAQLGYQHRTFRPHPNHIGGYDSGGTPVFAYLEATRDAALLPAAGAFPFLPNEGPNSANFGRMGVWTGHDADDFELDSDNDGDGIKEGIWLNLGYPIEETSDGRFYITLFSYTIYDLDGLLNLNAHGNLAELPRSATIDASIVGSGNLLDTTVLSASNQGLGPNEVNPIYALLPDATGTDSRFVDWYTANPFSVLEQANMEWIWLLTGNMRWDTDLSDWTDLQPGRWGDVTELYNHKVGTESVDSLPRPGLADNMGNGASPPPEFNGMDGFDDNADVFEGAGPLVSTALRGFVHPMDFAGSGTNRDAADFRLPAMLLLSATEPVAWAGYGGYSAVRDATNTLNDSLYMAGVDQTHNTADDLAVSNFFHALFEDPLETIMDLDLAIRPDDEIFSVQDMLIAHLTDSDKTNAEGEVGDRLRELAPFTFAAGSDRAERFTSLSHSLRVNPLRHQLGVNNAFDSGGVDDGPRWWEWSALVDSAPAFPPQFDSSVAYAADDPFRPQLRALLTAATGSPTQNPWQMPVSPNHVLDIRSRDLLPDETIASYLAHIDTYGLEYRTLVEHPTDTAATTVTALPVAQPAFSDPPVFGNAADQEYWARLDRQRLARDIYVMLYTFGGTEVTTAAPLNTIKDYTDPNNGAVRPLYSEERLRQMAQFAVNLVDAMDTDNVVTRFEYDKNLGDGWDVDDLPWTDTDDASLDTSVPADVTDNGLYPNDVGNRGVVFGVEAQQLTISEVLAVRSEDFPNGVSDSQATDYDDTNGSTTPDSEDRYLLHVELQNILPMEVNLSPAGVPAAPQDNPILPANKAHDEAVWRLARFDRSTRVSVTTATDAQIARPDRTLSIMSDGGTNDHVITGGGRFTIGMAAMLDNALFTSVTADPTGFGNADLYIDSGTPDGNFELISPDGGAVTVTTGATPAPLCDLDVIYNMPAENTRWIMTDGDPDHTTATKHNAVTDRGYFLEHLNDATHDYLGNTDFGFGTGDDGFDIVLQRRANPNLPLLPTSENPWVEVDRFNFEFYDLFDTSSDPAVLRLQDLLSFERTEPLDAITTDTTNKEPSPTNNRYHTIGNVNDRNKTFPGATVNPFQLWQAHFDRDYASSGELLNLPIIGPKLLTRRVDRMRYAGFQQAHVTPSTPSGVPDPDLIAGAAGMFLQPELPGVASSAEHNAWYRLLQFVEVPTRVNRALQDAIDLERLPGKINLNTLRHREIYAGLLDELLIANPPALTDPGGNGDLDGPFFTSTPALDGTDGSPVLTTDRDRWLEFIHERDGYVNTLSGGTSVQMWLPGTPNSQPFRSYGYTEGNVAAGHDLAIDQTILRRLGKDRQQTAANPFGEPADVTDTNRHWLEPGDLTFHQTPESTSQTANMVHRHQILSKIMNNTTTVSNSFIMYATAGYFEAVYDTSSGVFRIGGRMGLDLDDDGNENNDSGWEKRALFIVDRTELFNAYDEATGELDWERLVIDRLDLASDGQ